MDPTCLAFIGAPLPLRATSPDCVRLRLNRHKKTFSRALRRKRADYAFACASHEAAKATALQPMRRTGKPNGVTVVLLAGGVGKRMGSKLPKQLLPLRGLTVLERSLAALSNLPEVSELVVVLDESLRDTHAGRACTSAGAVFASPGAERVDSVAAGVAAASVNATMFCIHDAARPLVRREDVRKVISDAWECGAAVLAVPCKATVKRSEDGLHVDETLDRSKLWEMQTPQAVDAETLRNGLEAASKMPSAKVTDDVSLVELLGLPVKLTHGAYDNIKITTPEDMLFADAVLQAMEEEADVSMVGSAQ